MHHVEQNGYICAYPILYYWLSALKYMTRFLQVLFCY